MSAEMKSIEYEKALFEKLLYEFRSPFFQVIHNSRIRGKHSKGSRQIDVAVFRAGVKTPFLVAEAKNHDRKLEIEYIEAFVTKLKDVQAQIGIMVVSSDYSMPGRNLAKAFGVELQIMTIAEALEMKWRAVARDIFPLDWAFHPQMATGLYYLNQQGAPGTIIDAIELIPYEEWEAFCLFGLRYNTNEAIKLLEFIATRHYDDGWRYNAIRLLIENSLLSEELIIRVRIREGDPGILELLEDYYPSE